MGAWYSILVRTQDEDRGVELTTDSCVRTLTAEAERVGRAEPEDDMVQPGGQKAGFCGKGLRHWLVQTVAFTGVEALVSDTLRAGQAAARLGVGVSAKMRVLVAECGLSTLLGALSCSLPGGDGAGTCRSVMEILPAFEAGLDTADATLLCWPPLMV